MDQAPISSRSSSTSTSKLICLDHQWTIDNYSQVDEIYSPGQCVTSSQFCSIDDTQTKFSMVLYPKNHDIDCQNWLSVFFKRNSLPSDEEKEGDGPIYTFKVAVMGDIGQFVNQCVFQSKLPNEHCFGFTRFIDRENLLLASNAFLPNQKLSLYCGISYLLNEPIETFAEHRITQIFPNMSSQLGQYSECQVSFKTSDGVVVKGHQCILMSASKSFEKLLRKAQMHSTVELSDVSSNVFREVLNFIYTGKVHRLDKYNAIELLNAAEKFQLDHFRSYCADRIRASLPPEEANQILVRLPLAITPDVCLLAIFDYVPIQTLFELRKVCTRWKALFTAACARRTNLTLLAHGYDYDYTLKPNDIDFGLFDIPCQEDLLTEEGIPSMSHSMNASLVGLYKREPQSIEILYTNVSTAFENITHFKIVNLCANNVAVNSLTTLLRHYSNKLISLKLRLSLNNVSIGEIESQFECISSMSSLTHLTLHYLICHESNSLSSNTQIQPPLPPSLKELNYYCGFTFDHPSFVNSVLRNMPKLKRIAISKYELDDKYNANKPTPAQEQFRADSVPIGERITSFSFKHYIDNLTATRRISYFVPNFPSLTSLQLSLVNLPIRQILPLTSLNRLVYLKISFRLNLRSKESIITPLDPHFTSVQVLELNFTNSSRPSLAHFCIGHTFPALQVIRLDIKKVHGMCHNCSKKHWLTGIPECVSYSLSPLKHCDKLKKIYINYDYNVEFEEWTQPIV